jgi:hypothetical protein
VRQYGIADKVAATAAQIFKESAEFANVLNNGIVSADGSFDNCENDERSVDDLSGPQQAPVTATQTFPQVITQLTESGDTMNEQGVNHSGRNWGLTVLVKSGHRLPTDLRTSIRDLLESADDVADKFYELEKGDEM